MALEVIGAGFGRTGTLSLKAALEGLGYRKCHHMEAVATSSEQLAHWHAIALGGEPDWEQVFDGYRAACDWPSCAYWEPLLGKFPDAKVVLSVRDEDRWYHSVATTIYPLSSVVRRSFLRLIPRLRRYGEMVFGIVWDGTFAGRFEDRAAAIQVFRDHNARVIADVPSDRLLVFDPKDGWEPLCAFLGVPVPAGDFPHLNDGERIQKLVRILRVIVWGAPVALVGSLAGLVWWLAQ